MSAHHAALALIALLFGGAAQAGALQLQRLTPSGIEAPAGSQIVLGFDRAVVPLGRMERRADEVPVTITPDPACRWRWLDPQNLACQLADSAQLQPATAYTVEIGTGFTALDGSALAEAQTHRFVTETPRVQYASIAAWRGPTEPVYRIWFNQPVSAASVIRALSLDGAALRAEPDRDDSELPFYTREGEARQLWRVMPARPLAVDQGFALRVQPGLRSALGPIAGRESRVVAKAHTFAAPRALGLQCSDGSRTRRITAGERCAPLEGVGVIFNVPVSSGALRAALTITPDAKSPAADENLAGDADDARPRVFSGNHSRDEPFVVALPFLLAAETDYTLRIAGSLRDRFGRVLGSDAALRFATAARTPRLVFEHTPAVLESGVDSEVPVFVTNLAQLDARYRVLTASGVEAPRSMTRKVDPVRNLAFAMPLGVREMLGGGSGAVLGELASTPSTAPRPLPFFAAVTPWQIHAKYGHSGLLVWVTSLADGTAIGEAEVAVLDGYGGEIRARGRTDKQGLATLPGSAELDPKLERQYVGVDALHADPKHPRPAPLMLRVTRGKDLALLPLSTEFQVDTWRASREQIWASRRQRHGHLRSWGASAQGVYRVGDTVQYKLYVRDDAGASLRAALADAYTLRVIDPAGNAVHERKALRLSAFGAIDGAFKLTSSAAVGWYRFELTPAYAETLTLEPLRVLVSDFVPAPFRVSAELRAARAEAGVALNAAVRANLHGGGPFASAPARLSARVQAGSLPLDDPLATEFRFDSVQRGPRDSAALLAREAVLDARGEWSEALTPGDSNVVIGQLLLEASVQDDRGRTVVSSASTPYFGRDRYIGLRNESGWMQAGRAATLDTLVVDQSGHPQQNVPYYVTIERKITRGARVKGAGNAYVTRYSSQWQRIASCQGRSRLKGNSCRFTPDAGGELRAIAKVRDSKHRLHETSTWLYAQGANAVLWEDTPDYALELRADRARYRVGDTAKLFVKNPFPGATALITVERYGVLESRTQVLKSATPVIELLIKPEHLPGAYVSVVVMSPRVEAPIKNQVDLGKPTFRMGYATLNVEDPYRELQLVVKPAKTMLRPRESVTVALQATPRHASAEPVEFAVAVLDEAVFDLIAEGRGYFDPLKGFSQLDALDLANYSLLTRLVGRQKFEKKGASPGGDGGADLSLRSVEQFVAYWNPSLKADAQGRAQFTFKTPDNLSGWRVLAMAVTPSDRMGLGDATIAVSKPTELRSALPNQIARGDRFDAAFSVMNREKTARKLTVTLAASGAAVGEHTQTLQLQPFERRSVMLPLTVTGAGAVQFTASAGDASDRDALAVSVPVRERPPTVTAADFAALSSDAPLTIPLRVPVDAQDARLRVAFAPTLLGSLDGAFRYLAEYPYLCWEQRLTKAVMAAHYLQQRNQMSDPPPWPGAEALAKTTLDDAASFQAPGGGMSFFVPKNEYQSPYLSAYTALAFGWLQRLGYTPPAEVWDRLDTYLQTLLRENIDVQGYASAENRAQVRALALAALAQRGKLSAAELARQQAQLPRMGLFGEALFAQAAALTQGGDGAMQLAQARLLARGERSAGTLLLADEGDGDEAWLLGSPLRGNCAALSALLADRQIDAGLAQRLTRAITQARGARTHWANTQENVFCTRALIDYAARFEAEPLQQRITVALADKPLGSVELARGRSAALEQRLAKRETEVDQQLQISVTGCGRSYAMTSLRYATAPPQAAVQAGLTIARAYFVRRDDRWLPLDGAPMRVTQGEAVKIELRLQVPATMHFVVVDDPVPAGLEPLNPDLATTAGFAADELALAGPAYPYPFYHRELRFNAARFYAEALDAGEYRLAWIAQAVASGEFAVMEPHAERMYDPDVHANGIATRLLVVPRP